MGKPVILTPQARHDLQEIVRFIRRDSPERARSFGHDLIDAALALAPFPERGRVVPELDDPAVREVVHGSYRIIYEIVGEPGAIYILRFWHGARGTPEKGQ
jgi:toxin ParE1/3/4